MSTELIGHYLTENKLPFCVDCAESQEASLWEVESPIMQGKQEDEDLECVACRDKICKRTHFITVIRRFYQLAEVKVQAGHYSHAVAEAKRQVYVGEVLASNLKWSEMRVENLTPEVLDD